MGRIQIQAGENAGHDFLSPGEDAERSILAGFGGIDADVVIARFRDPIFAHAEALVIAEFHDRIVGAIGLGNNLDDEVRRTLDRDLLELR